MKYQFVCVTVTATWPKIGWIFQVFHESLKAMERKLSPDIGQCTFVYFSLEKSVGTTWSSISTLGNSLFCEKMGFERESTKFSCFSRILECYGEKTK